MIYAVLNFGMIRTYKRKGGIPKETMVNNQKIDIAVGCLLEREKPASTAAPILLTFPLFSILQNIKCTSPSLHVIEFDHHSKQPSPLN